MSPLPDGRTSREEALDLLQQASDAMQEARALVTGRRPTKANRLKAFRLLSRVESSCAVLKIALDPY